MTDQQLRDLLEERVGDVTMPDVSAAAWQAGRRTRRRERLTVLGSVALVAVVASTGVAVLSQDGSPTGPAPAPGDPAASSGSSSGGDAPDATFEGVSVWWSLAQEQEGNLPRVEGAPLPEVIDLRSGPMVTGMDRAVAAFSVGEEIRLVDGDGGQQSVSIADLEDVVKPNGYGYRPVHASMLSPSGEYLVLPQNGGVEVYTVRTGTWRSIDTGDTTTRFVTWVGDDAFVLPRAPGKAGPALTVTGEPALQGDVLVESEQHRPPFATGQSQAFGPTRRSPGGSVAQTWGMGVNIPVADPGSYLSFPEFIAAGTREGSSVLAIMWNVRDGGHEGRFLQCCPVAGWLDDDTLVYESRQTDPSLVAWTVGTDDFGLVSRIQGNYLLVSFADLD